MREPFAIAIGTDHRIFWCFCMMRPAGIFSRIGRSVTWYSHC